MKKIVLTIAIVLGLGLMTFADPNGSGLFQRGIVSDEEYYGTGYYDNLRIGGSLLPPGLPYHNATEDQDAPLSGGIALLAGLGVAYLVRKKRKEI